MPQQWNLASLRPNSANRLHLNFDVEIPFTVLRGNSESPRVVILAGVHGDEYEGVAALHQMAAELDPFRLNGTVVIAPVVNPQAFAAGLRRNPIDAADLNRTFPGDPNGSVSNRLASLLLEELIDGNAAMLSLHGWSKEALVLPYGEYPLHNSEAGRRSKECAYHLGFEFLHPYEWPAGVLGNSALEKGIAAVETEIGGQGTVTREGQVLSRKIILKFLDFWGILSWEGAPSTVTSSEVDHADVFAESAGLFQPSIVIGEHVMSGSPLGTIRGFDGTILQKIIAPASGKVAILRTFASAQPGDRLVQIFFPG
jgi:N2-acetyl-L-2,4-diaminobutanoate deacetylase